MIHAVITGASSEEIKKTLEQLYWHHRSQANGAEPPRRSYHRELQQKLAKITGLPAK